MIEFLRFLSWLLGMYQIVVVATVAVSWLIAFNIVNVGSPAIRQLLGGLDALTEPALRPIKRLLPTTGGLDLSPLVLIILIEFVRTVVIPATSRL